MIENLHIPLWLCCQNLIAKKATVIVQYWPGINQQLHIKVCSVIVIVYSGDQERLSLSLTPSIINPKLLSTAGLCNFMLLLHGRSWPSIPSIFQSRGRHKMEDYKCWFGMFLRSKICQSLLVHRLHLIELLLLHEPNLVLSYWVLSYHGLCRFEIMV